MTREPAAVDSLVKKILLLLVLFTPLCLPCGASQDAAGSWPGVNLDAGATRYSPLAQITAANVGRLKVAWVYHMRPGHMKPEQVKSAQGAGGATDDPLRPSEDQPLVVGNTMYVVTPYSRVVALD